MPALDTLSRQIAALEARGRGRRLIGRAGLDFASNDYLGLSRDPAIARAIADAAARGVPAGSGGSRLLRGNAPEHEALEAQAAAFFGGEAALFLANGFAANVALLASLPQRGDLIVVDELIHASAHDGLKLSKAAHLLSRHNDPQSVADLIAGWRAQGGKGQVWIAFETVYSMDGDIAPVDALHEIAAQHDAMLIADEAHATGVFGAQGRGVAAHLEGTGRLVSLHTCGKALGVEGALVCGPRLVIDYLVNRARPFIFSTAPSPLIAVAVGAALDRVAQGDDLRAELQAVRKAAAQAISAPLALASSRSQILPVILGDDRRAMTVAAKLQAAGFDVRGIRPPTVPPGTSRLRISLTCNVTPGDVAALGQALREAMA